MFYDFYCVAPISMPQCCKADQVWSQEDIDEHSPAQKGTLDINGILGVDLSAFIGKGGAGGGAGGSGGGRPGWLNFIHLPKMPDMGALTGGMMGGGMGMSMGGGGGGASVEANMTGVVAETH